MWARAISRRITEASRVLAWVRILDSLAAELDLSVALIDGTCVKCHQHAADARQGAALPP